MAVITQADQFFGLAPGDWLEARFGDRQAMIATAKVLDDDGSDMGPVEVVTDDTPKKWRVQLEAREVRIEAATTAGTRTQTGGREGQSITLTSVLEVDEADMPLQPGSEIDREPVVESVDVELALPPYKPWAAGEEYDEDAAAEYPEDSHIIWRCKQMHTSEASGAKGPPSATSVYWERDPRVGKFTFVSPVSRQLNPQFDSAQLPGLVVWLIMSQGLERISRVMYGVVFRPGP